MKEKITAVILFILIIGFVITNTLVMRYQVGKMIGSISSLEIRNENAYVNASELYEEYTKLQNYISLTVNHEDLTNIEDCFVEMIGYINVDNQKDAEVTKNRLICSLEHLRRLSGFTLEAII